jgi:hypothetical protein
MTFDQTLPITPEALFWPIPKSLSTKDNTWTCLAVGVGGFLALYCAYKYGQHIATKNSLVTIAKLQQQVSALKVEEEELHDPILSLSA